MTPNQAHHYRADIDGLRAVAVLSVVGFHAAPRWIRGGFVGVDIFFVISGYLISTIILAGLESGRFRFLDFYSRRIRRIYPALLVVLAGTFAIGWMVLLPEQLGRLGKHMAGGAGFVSNLVLWSESGYFDVDGVTKPLLHLWSLGLEEQYYIVWPLLLWLGHKFRVNLLAASLLLAVLSFGINIGTVGHDATAAFYSPPSRFWELLAGSILAYLTLHKLTVLGRPKTAAVGTALSWTGGILLLVSLATIREAGFPGWWAMPPTLGSVLAIAAGPDAWLNRRVLSNPILVWIGLISFPLYLWHWPLLSFARILTDTPSRGLLAALVAAAFVLAWLTYQLVEKPVRWGSKSTAVPAVLFGLMASVGSLGFYSLQQGGFASRFPKFVQEVVQFRYDVTQDYRVGTCFLGPDQHYSDFDKCTDPQDAKPVLFLWGDSHAAQLYPGYLQFFGEKYAIVQRTTSGCPPVIGVGAVWHSYCTEINDQVLDRLLKVKPAKVVLAANWTYFPPARMDDVAAKLVGTVRRLQEAGIADISLVGPVPEWQHPFQTEFYRYTLSNRVDSLPSRMTYGLNRYFMEWEPRLAEVAQRTAIHYLSPMNVFCNDEGCLVRSGADASTLVTWDNAHLTGTGSRFLVSHFPLN